MNVLKIIFNFYINSSIHVALAVVSLTAISTLQFNVECDFTLLSFVFLATITGYNFVKYAGIAKLHHLSLAKNLRLIQIFSLLAFIGLVFLVFQLNITALIVSAVLGIFTILYALPVFGHQTNLRGVSGIKIFIIAMVWSGVTVLLPVLNNYSIYNVDVILGFIQRFFFVIVITLPFEIRDLKFDMARLGTIPQIYGIRKTRIIGFLMLGIFILLEFLKVDTNIGNVIGVFLVAVMCSYCLSRSTITQSKYFSSFWVEGIPIIWLFILLALGEIN